MLIQVLLLVCSGVVPPRGANGNGVADHGGQADQGVEADADGRSSVSPDLSSLLEGLEKMQKKQGKGETYIAEDADETTAPGDRVARGKSRSLQTRSTSTTSCHKAVAFIAHL